MRSLSTIFKCLGSGLFWRSLDARETLRESWLVALGDWELENTDKLLNWYVERCFNVQVTSITFNGTNWLLLQEQSIDFTVEFL